MKTNLASPPFVSSVSPVNRRERGLEQNARSGAGNATPKESDVSTNDLAALDAAWQQPPAPPAAPPAPSRATDGATPSPIRTTYSFWNAFRNCRKLNEWRYIHELVPIASDPALSFGSLIHRSLEVWHLHRDLEAALDVIDRELPERARDERQRRDWHLATAMMRGYAKRYPTEDFEVVALEKTFQGPITNPATGAASRTFVLAGRVDGIVRMDGRNYLLENKTAASIDASYLEKLWTDFQIALYSHYVSETLGLPISGVVYNILGKTRLQQGIGETEDEFEARRAELIAKSKTGRSSAKRKLPESDDEFQERLAEKYADPAMFHREEILLSQDRVENLRSELWELTQAYLEARRRGVYYENSSYCFSFRRPCAYFALCRSGGNPVVIENFYEKRAPHEELADEAPPEAEAGPSF
jgi:hypothetical protein